VAITSWIRRQFIDNASAIDYIPAGLSSGATSFTAHDGTTFPDGSVGPFIITVDQGLSTEEKILIASRSGSSFTVASSGRGYGTGGASASTHAANCSFLHTIDAQDLDEANQVAVQTLGAVAASGDLLVGASANTLTKLARGTASQFLQVVGTALQWTGFGSGGTTAVASSGADGTSANPARYDHTHAGVTTVNGSGGAITNLMASTTYDPAAIAQQVLGTTATQTVTAKRITRRVTTVTQSATPAINTDTTDVASITGLAQAITSMTTSLTGTPVDGDRLTVRITDNGTGRAITWGASFEASNAVPLPTTTVASVMLTTTFQWDSAGSKWQAIECSTPQYGGGILAYTRIVGPNYSATPATFVVIDSTNAKLTVVAPPSGNLLLTCSSYWVNGTVGTQILLRWSNGTTNNTNLLGSEVKSGFLDSGSYQNFENVVTGLTPGTSYTLAPQWAYTNVAGAIGAGQTIVDMVLKAIQL
jgi:hypothetical protein